MQSLMKSRRTTHLDRHLVGEFFPSLLGLLEASDNIVKRSSAPEVLLLQTQLLATLQAVVGVEDSGDRLGALLVCNGLLVLARVEFGEIELAVRSLARPESEVIGCTRAISRHRGIVGDRGDNLAILPDTNLLAALIRIFPDVAVELNIDRNIVSGEFPAYGQR